MDESTTNAALRESLDDHGFYEKGVDCSDIDRFADLVSSLAVEEEQTRNSTPSGTLVHLGVVMKYAARKMVDSQEHEEPIGLRDALDSSIMVADAHNERVVGDHKAAFIDLVDEIVIARVGEMPMPGEAADVVLGLSTALKKAGRELTAENTHSR
jgi:hypothetical protein